MTEAPLDHELQLHLRALNERHALRARRLRELHDAVDRETDEREVARRLNLSASDVRAVLREYGRLRP